MEGIGSFFSLMLASSRALLMVPCGICLVLTKPMPKSEFPHRNEHDGSYAAVDTKGQMAATYSHI
jgi:hypothetical protein